MKYKKFKEWCDYLACDGWWNHDEAMTCINIIEQVENYPFWKRERKWQELNNKYSIENNIVIPINNRFIDFYNKKRK